MTARRHLIASTLTFGLTIGLLAPFAPSASASVAASEATNVQVYGATARYQVDLIGDDPLAAFARTALLSFDTPAFDEQRDALAGAVAQRLWIEPQVLVDAWRDTTPRHQVALLAALTQLGVPYRRMRSEPGKGFDCSGLTTFAWSVSGTSLPRSSGSQIRAAARLTPETAKAGDLVWYPGHVMMSLGVPGAIVHSPQSGRDVQVELMKRTRGVRYGDPIA